jgi:hypothetical protein
VRVGERPGHFSGKLRPPLPSQLLRQYLRNKFTSVSPSSTLVYLFNQFRW